MSLLPALARAELPDDGQLDCTSNPHAFISSLIEQKSIEPQPTHVEANSVNAFRPTGGSHLHAFGFPIYMVFGYARDDALFRQGKGRTIDTSVYGVVVHAPAESVRARLAQAHSHAIVHPVVPLLLTAIACNGS